MTLIENDLYKEESREIDMPDGSKRVVNATVRIWSDVDFLMSLEGIPTSEMAEFAIEEMSLQPQYSFDEAFRGIVAYLANRWTQ